MGQLEDLTGRVFGRWTVIKRADPPTDKTGHPLWHCRCVCGNEANVYAQSLRSGSSRSCGCQQKEELVQRVRTHGDSYSRLYSIWKAMLARCYNPNFIQFDDYGGRGVTVCDEWLDYPTFKEWAISTSYNDNLTIDRIDTNGNYEPSNCRWATRREQILNRRVTRWYTMDGKTMCLRDWAREYNMDYGTLRARLRSGMDFVSAIHKPAQKHHKAVEQVTT